MSLTAEGNDGNIELTDTSLKINSYKKKLTGYDKSKIDKTHEIPTGVITEVRVLDKDFYVFVPEGFPGVDSSGYFHISIDVKGGAWQSFKNIAEEIGKQGYWYEDNSKLSHVASYTSEEEAATDANNAAKRGWRPVGSSATDGHVNIGRTLARGLIFGAHRSKGKITITYERTPEWLASHNKAVPSPSASSPSAPIQAIADDPLQKMRQLKEMLDAGLISESEFNTKKADLLSRM